MTKFETHRRNIAFSWPGLARRAPYEILTKGQANQFEEKGYALIENAFSPDVIADLATEIDPFEAEETAMLIREHGGQQGISRASAITFTSHLVKRSEKLRDFSKHPLFAKLCRDILGERVRLYWDQAVYKKTSGDDEFPWHQDTGYIYTDPQHFLTCWVAISDATLENGCLWIVPSLHKHGTFKHHNSPIGLQCLSNPDNAIAVPVQAGDMVIFSSLTPHRTGPNLTDTVRKAYILQFAIDGTVAWPDRLGNPVVQADPERQYLI
jgi:phytanoyl-CoA hydroxylase